MDVDEPQAAPTADLLDPSSSEVKIWATKGVHFWTLLGAILIRTRPDSILELGGGRSTTVLADYAFRSRVRCVSVEQSDLWFRKIVSDLGFMHVRGVHVHHVPVTRLPGEAPWYDFQAMEKLLGGRAFDFVLVDGPQGGARRNPRGQALIAKAARDARILMVDDVHRPYNLACFEDLAARFPPDGRFFYRYGRNLIAIGAGECREAVRSCFDFLGLPYLAAPAAGDISEGGEDD